MTGGKTTIVSPEELQARLNAVIPKDGRICIGVDGMDGVGKSTLAHAMAKRLGGSVVSLDNHLDKKQNRYTHHIRCNELKAALSASAPPILIEGVCLLAVAHRCDFNVDVLVYVRRLSRNSGIWHDQELCMGERPVAELKNVVRELRHIFAEGASATEASDATADEDLGLAGELIDYHAQWTPVQRAHLVFDVVDR
jgi:hypothetical protein